MVCLSRDRYSSYGVNSPPPPTCWERPVTPKKYTSNVKLENMKKNKKKYYPEIDPSINFPRVEESILKKWDKEKTFEKSRNCERE